MKLDHTVDLWELSPIISGCRCTLVEVGTIVLHADASQATAGSGTERLLLNQKKAAVTSSGSKELLAKLP